MGHDGGRKGRKVGKGVHKASHSRFGNYAGIFAHSERLKLARMSRAFCKACEIQFHSKNALKRHACTA